MLSNLLLNKRNPNPIFRAFKRAYQSENGVYGYRPLKKSTNFQVSEDKLHSRNSQGSVYRLVEAYRKYGHKLANVNPISIRTTSSNLDVLAPEFYGLNPSDIVRPHGLLSTTETQKYSEITFEKFEQYLKRVYTGTGVSAEFSYIENQEESEWLATNFEQVADQTVSNEARREIAALLIKSQALENFLATKFPTVKRYGGEGAESMYAFWWQLLQNAVENEKLEHIVVGQPHRGRTALQTVLFNMRPAKVFRKLSGESEFTDDVDAFCDVISHFHTAEELNIDGKNIRISLLRNPSHLEAVNPVSMGKTRSKQQTLGDGSFSDPAKPFSTSVLNVILHGDAAFSGQGINQECLNMAYTPHFEIGGTIHLIVNNQLGFTTPGDRGRSTEYTTDLAKTIQAPVFHVNGDDPEMVALVTKLAFSYQRKFRKDVFIDLNCFRRWGHNELDDPTFTNPSLYKIIHNRNSVPDMYVEKLSQQQILTAVESEKIRSDFMDYLNSELALAPTYKPEDLYFERQWKGLQLAPNAITYWDTGLDYSLLNLIGKQSVEVKEGFNVHPHLLKTHIQGRKKKLDAGEKIDWATAEALAIGSLMYQGHNVRISGEDVGRGTFSHRHAMLVDQETNEMVIPLNGLKGGNGKLEIAHSILSEEAVVGFEYGMAIDNPNNLIIWEAQFGDFANCAQIMIDNFIVSGETKWLDSNGLVILLPHGFDGAASEHSSCRIERFLQLSDSKETAVDGDNCNLHIVNPTTPAQYYHVLRRQLLRNFRKPLVIIAPKILLRLSAATSSYQEFQPGTHFRNVLGDDKVSPQQVRRVILCSGKHFYNLDEERKLKAITDTAIIRLESLSPFPLHELQQELEKYKNAKTFVWSQEEHRNMGAWNFVRPRFEYLVGKQILYCGRNEAATTATGIGKVHKQEAIEVVTSPFRA